MPLGKTFDIPLKLYRKYRLSQQPDFVIANEVVPVITVDDLSSYLADTATRPSRGRGSQQAAAAEFPISVLINNQAAERVEVVGCWVTAGANGDIIDIRRPTVAITGLTASTDKSFDDHNLPGQPVTVIGTDSVAAIPTSRILVRVRVLASSPVFFPLNLLLGTGINDGSRAVFVSNATAQGLLDVSWVWKEAVPAG